MPLMARKKDTRAGNRHTKPRLAFHLDQSLLDAIEKYRAENRPAPSVTTLIIVALEEFLERRGRWPSPKDAD